MATPSSRCRVDGVEVDAAIQDERAVNLISTQVGDREGLSAAPVAEASHGAAVSFVQISTSQRSADAVGALQFQSCGHEDAGQKTRPAAFRFIRAGPPFCGRRPHREDGKGVAEAAGVFHLDGAAHPSSHGHIVKGAPNRKKTLAAPVVEKGRAARAATT